MAASITWSDSVVADGDRLRNEAIWDSYVNTGVGSGHATSDLHDNHNRVPLTQVIDMSTVGEEYAWCLTPLDSVDMVVETNVWPDFDGGNELNGMGLLARLQSDVPTATMTCYRAVAWGSNDNADPTDDPDFGNVALYRIINGVATKIAEVIDAWRTYEGLAKDIGLRLKVTGTAGLVTCEVDITDTGDTAYRNVISFADSSADRITTGSYAGRYFKRGAATSAGQPFGRNFYAAVEGAAPVAHAFARRQTTNAIDNAVTSAGRSFQFDATVETGSLLIFAAATRPADVSGTAPVMTVTDDSGGGYVWNQVDQRSTTNHSGGLWWRIAQPGETTCSTLLTATWSSGAPTVSTHGVLHEYALDGASGTIALADSGGNAATTNVSSISTSAPLQVNDQDLVFAYGSIRNVTGPVLVGAPLISVIGYVEPNNYTLTDGEYFATETAPVTPTFDNQTAQAWVVAGVWRVSGGTPPAWDGSALRLGANKYRVRMHDGNKASIRSHDGLRF